MLLPTASAQQTGSLHGSLLSRRRILRLPAVVLPRVKAVIRPAGPAPQITASYFSILAHYCAGRTYLYALAAAVALGVHQ